MRRRKSNRLSHYDYSQNGYYFITICTKEHKPFFGEVLSESVIQNDIGRIVEECLCEIPNHFPNSRIDQYVVMPNHVHVVLIIEGNDIVAGNSPIDFSVGDRYICPLQRRNVELIPKIVGTFKAVVTRKIRRNHNSNFQWRRSYYDHIIRSEESLLKIQEYILNNPKKWALDKYNPENLL